mmetsp:Transcript_32444/g.49642  ORF Transcript_32444/g.49642 Transcript_32444/m.49642 type:complete len:111 (+) Transcript_32444:556-888(+)
MMGWIHETVANQSADPSIVWKAANMHHPMFAVHYSDNQGFIDHYLPILHENGYDVQFNGHEHMMNYASITPDQGEQVTPSGDNDTCYNEVELFPEGEARSFNVSKGDTLE